MRAPCKPMSSISILYWLVTRRVTIRVLGAQRCSIYLLGRILIPIVRNDRFKASTPNELDHLVGMIAGQFLIATVAQYKGVLRGATAEREEE